MSLSMYNHKKLTMVYSFEGKVFLTDVLVNVDTVLRWERREPTGTNPAHTIVYQAGCAFDVLETLEQIMAADENGVVPNVGG
jgi:hypothetical protein